MGQQKVFLEIFLEIFRISMMNQVNYQKELDRMIASFQTEGVRPKLLLHCCCAPCSSYVLEYLTQYFEITVFFYNPNIYPEEEYVFRREELRRLIPGLKEARDWNMDVGFAEGNYEPEVFFHMSKGLEAVPEGGERCFACYEMRLRKTAAYAKEHGYDYFTTTLSISPLKNAGRLNEIGAVLSSEYQVPYLFSDFKKKNGYQRSIELSKEFQLYRQNYCGCVYSKRKEIES